jgi:exo-beta-1,3-glucanase (GH17 family)
MDDGPEVIRVYGLRFIFWRHSWMRSDSAEPVTARPTGYWQDDGTGKQSNSYVPNRSIKEVLGCPLRKRFRELLGEVGFPPNGVVSM